MALFVTSVSTTNIDVYQKIPSVTNNPDYTYALNISENLSISSPLQNGATFLIQDPIDFTHSSSLDPTEITLYDNNYYLLKKTRRAISAQINTTTFTFGDPQKFQTVQVTGDNIIKILDITDSDGNK